MRRVFLLDFWSVWFGTFLYENKKKVSKNGLKFLAKV